MRRQIVKTSLFSSLCVVSAILLSGCGGQPAAADKPNQVAKSPDAPPGPAKTADATSTATPTTAARAADSQPRAPEPVARAEPPAAPKILEDVCQFAEVLDLGKLPVPTGGTIGNTSPTRFSANVPLSVRAAVDFYLAKLDPLGWKPAGPNMSESVTDAFAQVSLEKGNYRLAMTAMPGDGKLTGVEIEHHGGLDSRTLPRVPGAQDQYSDRASSLYFTTGKIDKAVDELRRLLKAEGWQEYDRAFSQKASRPDADDLLFRKKAYSLAVSISKPAAQPDKPPQPDRLAVQYFITTLARDMPAPPDAGHVEIEDSRWIMTCETPRDMASAADFYRAAMKPIGFNDPPHESASDKSQAQGQWRSLSFESPDHDLVIVSIEAGKTAGAKVKLEGYSAAFREALKKAETAARQKHEAQEKAAAADKAARAKAFKEESDRQDRLIESAIGNAVKSATQSTSRGGSSKKSEDDINATIEKALKDAGMSDVPHPDAKPAK